MTSTVLIVDDSLVIRRVVAGWLELQGYRVVEVEDGEKAIAQCLAAPPDVVLLDIEMPGMDGHEVLKRLKANNGVKHIPVVFLTNHTSMDAVLRGLEGGAHDYLSKPFEPAELVARVGAAARVKKLQDELQRRNVTLEKLNRTDLLTGLFNRRHLEEQLRTQIRLSRRHGSTFGLILLDIDHFKAVNDTFGHLAGDEVLCEVARRIGAAMRTGDVAGRWGGEEFLVLLPSTDLQGAVEAGERLCADIRTPKFRISGRDFPLTISGGCAEGPGTAASSDELVHRADTRLYEAKAGGRDRIVSSGGLAAEL